MPVTDSASDATSAAQTDEKANDKTNDKAMPEPLLPGTPLGMIGGGQLGRFFVLEARRLGYPVWVLDPNPDAPAMQLADERLVADYDDTEALDRLSEACAAVSVEFENVPAASLARVAEKARIAPSESAVSVAQSRQLEKQRAREAGLSPVPFAVIDSSDDVASAVATCGLPAILKTDRLGYDGKGQRVCHREEDVLEAVREWQCTTVLEQRIELAAEISVVLARGFDGNSKCYPVAENVHRNGILHTSLVPARVDEALKEKAATLAMQLADALDYVGVLAVEFFIAADGELYFNEMAPRPHNSGHYTLDATVASQFEQQLRMLCALPPASVKLLSPVCMLNLLGDRWFDGNGDAREGGPNWGAMLDQSPLALHLYGKAEARPGRKMAHVNCLADDVDEALALAETLHQRLEG